MTLGLAFFLSTLVVSAVLLYHWGHLSKLSRYNWKKSLPVIASSFSLLFLVGGSLIGYRYYQNMPKAQFQYCDLDLGMSMEEVIYIKGEPTFVLGEESNDPIFRGREVIAVEKLLGMKGVKNYLDWQYENPKSSSRIDVYFSTKTNKISTIGCYSKGIGECNILGIYSGMSEDAVFDILGKPEHVKIDGVTKIIEYPHLNLTLYLSHKTVYMIKIESTKG